MTIAKGKIAKHAKTTGDNHAGLGRWNHVGIVNGVKNATRVCMPMCAIKTSLGTM